MRFFALMTLAASLGFAASLGPAVGATAPDFALPDQNGQTRPLHSLMGPKGLMLVFFRSADW